MMDSFKVYLPSNACQFTYPDNKPSDYRTHLDDAIRLDGDWEVGVESIFYSANVDKTSDSTSVQCSVTAKEYVLSTAECFYDTHKKLQLHKKIDWKRALKLQPLQFFERKPHAVQNVIKTLNDMSKQLVSEASEPAFKFDQYAFSMNAALKNCYILLTPRLLEVLGYDDDTILSRRGARLERFRQITPGFLKREDYEMLIVNTDRKYKQYRIMIKPFGVDFAGGEEAFLALWKRTVGKINDKLVASFKEKKLVIDIKDPKQCIVLSRHLSRDVGLKMAIFDRGNKEGKYAANLEKGQTMKIWHIDVFKFEVEPMYKDVHHQFVLDFYPWKYASVRQAMDGMNEQVKNEATKKLQSLYYVNDHKFQLTLSPSGYSKLYLASNISVKFNESLNHFFGLSKKSAKTELGTEFDSMRQISNIIKHEEQLFLLSNIVKTTAYGQRHLPILQSFLHKRKNVPVMTRRFQPIIYLPVLYRNINTIEIQLTNADYEPINIDDTTTIVCLYFRKVGEKTVT